MVQAIPLFLLAKDKKLKPIICYALLISYLLFYGVQNALWFDVHSAVFGTSFLAWFLYFLDKKKIKLSVLFFLLAIISKENIAMLTAVVSIVYYVKRHDLKDLLFFIASVFYLLLIFGVYFPHFTKLGYEYESTNGLLGSINLINFFNTPNKRAVFLYSLGSYGFLPLLSPLSLLPSLSDLFSYFVIGNNIREADGIFMHYRVTLVPLLTWSTILTITRFKYLNKTSIALYLLLSAICIQYWLHLPLSYLTKDWFWQEKPAVYNINQLTHYLPADASVVSQNNITPHLSQRKEIFTLWPEKIKSKNNAVCRQSTCSWLMWKSNTPKYLIVDTSSNWDIRHLLTHREEYIDGLHNLEKAGYIKKEKQIGNAVLYKIIKESTR